MSLFNNKKRELKPIELSIANEFVRRFHRHNKPTIGHIFSVGLYEHDKLIGVAICGRPVSRHLDNGETLEINRVCTDGSRNANSQLYGYCRKIARKRGYKRIITYTLQSESGSSLKAIGAKIDKTVEHTNQWSNNVRKREHQEIFTIPKFTWLI